MSMTSYINFFLGFLFYDFFWIFWFFAFFGFYSFLYFYHCSSVFVFRSLLLFMFTHRWSTVHRTWGTVLWHVRVPSSSNLLCGKLNGAVLHVLDMEHLASWGDRQGPCALVIMISSNRAPGSVSQFKLLLQESWIWNYEKVNR